MRGSWAPHTIWCMNVVRTAAGSPAAPGCATREPAPGHWLEISIGQGAGIEYEITCMEPEGSRCRMDCAEACMDFLCDHEKVDQGRCVALDWFAHDEVDLFSDLYIGGDHPMASGWIDVTWNDHGCEWKYTGSAPVRRHAVEGHTTQVAALVAEPTQLPPLDQRIAALVTRAYGGKTNV